MPHVKFVQSLCERGNFPLGLVETEDTPPSQDIDNIVNTLRGWRGESPSNFSLYIALLCFFLALEPMVQQSSQMRLIIYGQVLFNELSMSVKGSPLPLYENSNP